MIYYILLWIALTIVGLIRHDDVVFSTCLIIASIWAAAYWIKEEK